jgi:hypothetical protein
MSRPRPDYYVFVRREKSWHYDFFWACNDETAIGCFLEYETYHFVDLDLKACPDIPRLQEENCPALLVRSKDETVLAKGKLLN